MRRVIIESPYGSDSDEVLGRNVAYARAALQESLLRGEAPFASHLLYTQSGVLDDRDPRQRALGIEAGLDWGSLADATIVYTDLGLTSGMQTGISRALSLGRPVEYRSLPDWS